MDLTRQEFTVLQFVNNLIYQSFKFSNDAVFIILEMQIIVGDWQTYCQSWLVRLSGCIDKRYLMSTSMGCNINTAFPFKSANSE